ncbi:MAG TPA: 30S ribosomal protein S16 [Bellilinea sp.]|mgnify:CR=1 FL=1|nr:30S ribosomal protein S16 [Bellilinea sp.]
MVRIRLRRTGLKGQASYRIVATEKESPRDGKFLEILGHYNPRTEPFTFEVNEDRIYHWMKNGAQPSDSVMQLFRSVELDKRFERVKAGEDAAEVLKDAAAFYEKRKAAATK